jgi:hypothetical protein
LIPDFRCQNWDKRLDVTRLHLRATVDNGSHGNQG